MSCTTQRLGSDQGGSTALSVRCVAMEMCEERERERVRRRGSIILTIRHLLRGVYERASEGSKEIGMRVSLRISEWWLMWLDRCVVALVGGLVMGLLGGWLVFMCV